jgi:di/tricarboxylate transporter
MTPDMAIVFVLLIAALVAFSLEWLPVDAITLSLIALLALTGVLTPQEALSGFANEVLLILASVFVISGTLIRTGILDWLARLLQRFGQRSPRFALTPLMGLAAAMSAFLSNTSATAILAPTAIELSRQVGRSPSLLLMPLAYAAILGGTCTLIGTSTNMAGSSLIMRLGLEPFSLFEFTGIGMILAFVGVLYLATLGHRLVPARSPVQLKDDYDLHPYLSVLIPAENSPALGRTLGDLAFEKRGLTPLIVIRDGKRRPAHGLQKIRPGMRIITRGTSEALLRAQVEPSFVIEALPEAVDAGAAEDEFATGEAVLMPQSHLVGHRLGRIDFLRRFGLAVLALHRRGQGQPAEIGNVRLRVGDVLLLQGPRKNLEQLRGNLDLWGLMAVDHYPPTRRQGAFALTALGLAVLAGATGLVPLSIALLVAALALVLSRGVTMEDAYRMIEWRLLILIGGMTSFGFAMMKTGAAEYLAQGFVAATLPYGPYAALAALSVTAVLLTQPMSNAAAALVVLPVAVATAQSIGIDPRSAAILVTLSASLSFITPLEPASLLVYGAGKFRFLDFLRAGLPLTVLVVVLLLWLVPVFWPLY